MAEEAAEEPGSLWRFDDYDEACPHLNEIEKGDATSFIVGWVDDGDIEPVSFCDDDVSLDGLNDNWHRAFCESFHASGDLTGKEAASFQGFDDCKSGGNILQRNLVVFA